MLKVKWNLEEAVALYDLYRREGCTLNVSKKELEKLSEIYKKRAKMIGLKVDEKFRNLSGLSMQIGCIHFVVTDGKEGVSNASKLFYQVHDLFFTKPEIYQMILDEFYQKYSNYNSGLHHKSAIKRFKNHLPILTL